MSRQIQIRRGTTAENDAFTGAEGEITCDTQTHELRVHDGSTQGGHVISTKNSFYSKSETDTIAAAKANTDLDNITNDGKEVCANLAMPSGQYVSLTLGASNATYTMSHTGWLSLYVSQPGSYNYQFQIKNQTRGDFRSRVYQPVNDWCMYIPVIKGDVIQIEYSNFPASYQLCLYKAIGIN